MITIEDMLAEVDRELAMRRRVYPRFVAEGKMTQAAADTQLARLEAIREHLRQSHEPPQADLVLEAPPPGFELPDWRKLPANCSPERWRKWESDMLRAIEGCKTIAELEPLERGPDLQRAARGYPGMAATISAAVVAASTRIRHPAAMVQR
jgi:hypothetical protein